MSEPKKYHRTKVEFLDMRRFFPESYAKDIESRDVEAAWKMCPDGCCAFKFYDEEYEKAATEAGEILEVKHRNVRHSPTYYLPSAEVLDKAVVSHLHQMNPERYAILLRNMENNDIRRVVRTRTGNTTPFKEGDVVLGPRALKKTTDAKEKSDEDVIGWGSI